MDNPVYKLLIVEDDLGIAQAIQTQASMWNFDVRIVENFRDVTGEVTSFSPHIILLDITLPFFNGYHWCSEIRKFSRVPIIFISSAADNMNIIMAMNLGADDFVAKPFDLNVLLAKIQALLRRSYDFAPVSYTHLDVYKRQIHTHPCKRSIQIFACIHIISMAFINNYDL